MALSAEDISQITQIFGSMFTAFTAQNPVNRMTPPPFTAPDEAEKKELLDFAIKVHFPRCIHHKFASDVELICNKTTDGVKPLGLISTHTDILRRVRQEFLEKEKVRVAQERAEHAEFAAQTGGNRPNQGQGNQGGQGSRQGQPQTAGAR